MRQNQKGQSLVELVICLPLFTLFLVATIQIGSVLLIQADLASLSREAGLIRSRVSHLSDAQTLMAVRHLAKQSKQLDPYQLTLTIKPIGDAFGRWTENLTGSESIGGLVDNFTGTLLGENITLHYKLKKKGLAGWIFPEGFTLNEKISIKSDHFKHPVQSAFESFFKG